MLRDNKLRPLNSGPCLPMLSEGVSNWSDLPTKSRVQIYQGPAGRHIYCRVPKMSNSTGPYGRQNAQLMQCNVTQCTTNTKLSYLNSPSTALINTNGIWCYPNRLFDSRTSDKSTMPGWFCGTLILVNAVFARVLLGPDGRQITN